MCLPFNELQIRSKLCKNNLWIIYKTPVLLQRRKFPECDIALSFAVCQFFICAILTPFTVLPLVIPLYWLLPILPIDEIDPSSLFREIPWLSTVDSLFVVGRSLLGFFYIRSVYFVRTCSDYTLSWTLLSSRLPPVTPSLHFLTPTFHFLHFDLPFHSYYYFPEPSVVSLSILSKFILVTIKGLKLRVSTPILFGWHPLFLPLSGHPVCHQVHSHFLQIGSSTPLHLDRTVPSSNLYLESRTR